jgi:probable HAF family extracellular repeat protein
LPTLGGDEAYGFGINDSGEVVGSAQLASGAWHAFFWSASDGITDLGTLGGGTSSTARDINSTGEVVGESATATAVHAFLWTSAGGLQDLGTLGGADSKACAIGNAGYIVGTSQTASGAWHAFGWDQNQMDDLNDLLPNGSGWVVTEAWGVNLTGDVIGRGNKQAFLMRK